MDRPVVPIVAVLLVASVAGPVAAATEGQPAFSVYLPDNHVSAGEEATLELFLTNVGDVTEEGPAEEESLVTTARNLTVGLGAGEAPVEVRTATRPVGDVPEGQVGPIAFSVTVDESAEPGTYRIPVTLAYHHTSEIDSSGDPTDPDTERETVRRTHTVAIVVESHARFAARTVSTSGAYIGEAGQLAFTIENVGPEPATNARVTLQSDDPALTFAGGQTAQVFVGDWAPGERRTVRVTGRFAPDAADRPVAVGATVAFEDPDGDRRTSEPLQFGAVPAAVSSRFAVVNATADVAVGERGTVALTLRNAGDTAVSEARVTVESVDAGLSFGGAPTASVFTGTWAPGDVRTVALDAGVAAGSDVRPYPLSVVVAYRSPAGTVKESGPVTVGVTPRPDQSFALDVVQSTLAVGDDGTVRGTVTNTGPTAVRNPVVVFSSDTPTLVPGETEYALDDLGPGESASFAFDAEVSDSADAGPRQLSFVVRFRDAAGDVRRSDPLDARVEVGPRRPVFTVERVSGPARAGETGVLEVRVTNAGDGPVTDVSAKLFTDDPLSSSDDEAFVDRLAPGESSRIRFALTAAPDALDKRYPVSLDFQYDDADGDTRLSDTYRLAVSVAPAENGDRLPLAIAAGAVVAAALLVGGLWYWRRR